jgi:hypothetical protein
MQDDDRAGGVDLGKEPAEQGRVRDGENGDVRGEEDLDEEEGNDDEELGEKDCAGQPEKRGQQETHAGICVCGAGGLQRSRGAAPRRSSGRGTQRARAVVAASSQADAT